MNPAQPSQSDRPTLPAPAGRYAQKYDSITPPTLVALAEALDALTGPRPPSRNPELRRPEAP